MTELLILGGTGEARLLADRLAGRAGLAVTTSLAGRTARPRLPAGRVRRGGFGGAEGLARHLAAAKVDLLIDATHPFAARISRNAARAAALAEVPRLMLVRPPWRATAADRWIPVKDAPAAAARLAEIPGPAFLAIGRQELAAFAGLGDRPLVVRLVEPPPQPLALAGAALVIGRGPFTAAGERALFAAHGIAVVVAKNAGGEGGFAKIEAAREAGMPVIMIARPRLPQGERAASVDEALAWIEARMGAG